VTTYRTNKVTIRSGSRERITFNLKSDNRPVDLTGYTAARVHLRKLDGETVTIYSTNDAGPLLSFDVDPTLGRLHLDPSPTTFTNTDDYLVGYIVVTSGSGKEYAYEEDEEFGIVVRPQWTSTTSSSTTSSSTTTSTT